MNTNVTTMLLSIVYMYITTLRIRVRVGVFNATFNNISVQQP